MQADSTCLCTDSNFCRQVEISQIKENVNSWMDEKNLANNVSHILFRVVQARHHIAHIDCRFVHSRAKLIKRSSPIFDGFRNN